ncbi:hypothetical protein ACWDFL_30885 [Streptomyces bungoensis]
MELHAVAEELYGLRPEEFVAARDRCAARARASGDRALAKEIAALRRPSLSAWVSNLLVRRRSAEVRPLLALGDELRRAHRELDGSRLRLLARRQGEVIGALGRQARRLAAEAGHPVGDGVQREVEETLHAVLADPEAARQWAAGRLVKPLSAAIGFPAADEAAVARRPTPPAAPAEPAVRKEDEERRRRLAEARERAREAERELRARRDEATAAEAEAAEAARRAADAEQRLADLRARLQRAQEEQRQARTEERDTRDRARTAAQAVRKAERRARDATARAEELASNDD